MTIEEILRQIYYFEGFLDAHEYLVSGDDVSVEFVSNVSQMLYDLRIKLIESHKTPE